MTTIRDLAASDMQRLRDAHGGTTAKWAVHPSFVACALVRARTRGSGPVSFAAHWMLLVLFGTDVGRTAQIGAGLLLPHPSGVVIGSGARVGARATLYQRATIGKGRADEMPTLEDDVTMLPGSVVFGGCQVGRGAVIGANTVVGRDVPARSAVPAAHPPIAEGAGWTP